MIIHLDAINYLKLKNNFIIVINCVTIHNFKI